MYFFFLCFFIFVSFSLVVLILLQPGKGLNNTVHFNTNNNIKFFNGPGTNSFITNIIRIFSCFFLVISVILCNINNRKVDSDIFWEDNNKKIITQTHASDKKILNSDIPD
ncbi:MAG: preprotein translocase subunit SecG [Buchnera aphidicola (Acyrthosiphon caraganae)]|nr:MAG: preprotein translocase subunit SecG [Buchnera aphidicola (Acyrthosiphon caraganae)]